MEEDLQRSIEPTDTARVKHFIQQRLAQPQHSKLKVGEDLIEEFIIGGCFPPVNAILGGLLANEMLKAVSKKGNPVNNFLFYDLISGAAVQQRHG